MDKSTIINITLISYLVIGILFFTFSIIIWKSKKSKSEKHTTEILKKESKLATFMGIYLSLLGLLFLSTSITLLFVQNFKIIIISGVLIFPLIIIGSIVVIKSFATF